MATNVGDPTDVVDTRDTTQVINQWHRDWHRTIYGFCQNWWLVGGGGGMGGRATECHLEIRNDIHNYAFAMLWFHQELYFECSVVYLNVDVGWLYRLPACIAWATVTPRIDWYLPVHWISACILIFESIKSLQPLLFLNYFSSGK